MFRQPRNAYCARCLNAAQARRLSKVFIRFADGSEWTYGQMLDITRRTAAGLQVLGVARGEHVLSWLPNGPDATRIWFGLNYLGAVYRIRGIAKRPESR